MSLALGVPLLECLYALACARWAWKRCFHSGAQDSKTWELALAEDFQSVPRVCRLVLAVYEEDLNHPQWAPDGGYRIDPSGVVKRVGYDGTEGRAPPYLIFVDHDFQDIVLAIRGLNLRKESDYAVLLNNRLGQEMFDGGYVHHGLLEAARWLLNKESDTLNDLVLKHPTYTLTFAGHSLGSGVASMLTMLAADNREKFGNLSREKIRGFAIAPARCMSLNLAVRHADIIRSIVLQDDFLPRTATPLEDIFKGLLCLPLLLCFRCMRDTCISEEKLLKDPRRLYAPGRLYHIVERELCRCGRYPPVVRTAVAVDGRFEHIVLSCNATSDHSIVWIERESEKALELMIKKKNGMEVPLLQKMSRQETMKEQHKAALERAVTLRIPHAFSPVEAVGSDVVEVDDGKALVVNEETDRASAQPVQARLMGERIIDEDLKNDFLRKEVLKKMGDD